MKRRQFFRYAAVGAVGLAMPALRTAQAATQKEFRIGWQKNGVVALAKRSGALEKLLEPRGFKVTWAEFTSGPPLLEALGAGALDFGPTGDVPPLFAQAARGNLVYVGTYSGSPEGSAILVPKDSKIQTLADLKGKKLAFKRGSSAHNFVVKALAKGGLKPDDVQAIDLAPPDAAAAFKTGSIDAWGIWDPYTAVAEKDPNTRILTTSRGIVDAWSFLLANRDFTTANSDVVRDVIVELARVGRAAQTDIEGSIAAISEITGVPADVTRVVLTRPDADLGNVAPMSDAAIAYQQALADQFYSLGIVPKKLTISDIVWQAKAG